MNERRVRLMTKLAEFEQDNKVDLDRVKTCYRSDYISVHLLKNLFRITLAFLIGFALWICYNFDTVLEMLNRMDIVGFGFRILFIYGIIAVLFLAVTYIIYSYRFYHNEKQFVKYQSMLNRLLTEYDRETGKNIRRSGHERRRERDRKEHGGRKDDSIVRH